MHPNYLVREITCRNTFFLTYFFSFYKVLRNCGHVMCNGCIDKFVKKSKTCYVCEHKTKSKDIIDMSPEGTGFASASTKAVAEKFNLCFQ